MILRIQKNKLLVNMFYGLLLFSIIGYTGYYLYTFSNNINVYNNFSAVSIDSFPINIIAVLIKFLKDILFICLLVLCVQTKTPNVKKMMLLFFFFVLYGAIIAIPNGDFFSVLSGIRGYLYFFILILYFFEIKSCPLSLTIVRNIILMGLLITCIVTFEQAFRGTDGLIFLAGMGGYRFTGLFGGFAPCSAFAAAACLFFYVYSVHFPLSKKIVVLILASSLLVELMCGSRSGAICVILILYVWLFKILPVKKIYKYFAVASTLVFVLVGIIKLVEMFANRGSILAVQIESGRIAIFNYVVDAIFQDPFTFMFGYGLGSGSNTSVLLGNVDSSLGTSLILDGTFNIILYQFGMLGVLVLIIFLLIMWLKLKKVFFDEKLLFWGITFVECLTGNVFESFAFLIIMFVIYKIMCSPNYFRTNF